MALWWLSIAYIFHVYVMVATWFSTVHSASDRGLKCYGTMCWLDD
jgi:hypothetical protein